jgi:hypothetical protein
MGPFGTGSISDGGARRNGWQNRPFSFHVLHVLRDKEADDSNYGREEREWRFSATYQKSSSTPSPIIGFNAAENASERNGGMVFFLYFYVKQCDPSKVSRIPQAWIWFVRVGGSESPCSWFLKNQPGGIRAVPSFTVTVFTPDILR